MKLAEFDETARGNLKKADESMRALDLDGAMKSLETAYRATYIMRFVGLINVPTIDFHIDLVRDSPYPTLLQRIVPPYVEQDLEFFGMTKWDIPDLHKEVGKFYAEGGYTTDALNSDRQLIDEHRCLVRHAQRGCFIDAQELEKLINPKTEFGERVNFNYGGGLPKPLISEEATSKVVEYASEHGEDGLEYWLQHAEDHVNRGFIKYPSEIPDSAGEKIRSYTEALGVPFPEKRFKQILNVNAKNVALDKIRVLQRIDPKRVSTDVNYRGQWLEREVREAEEYAQQAGLGFLYRLKLFVARKQAEKRLSVV